MAAHCAHLATYLVDEPLGFVARGLDRFVPLASRLASLVLGNDKRGLRPLLGKPGPRQRFGRFELCRLDRSQRFLERLLFVRQARPCVGDERRRQPQPFGYRERLALTGQPDRQAVGRAKRLHIELHRGVAGLRRGVGVKL